MRAATGRAQFEDAAAFAINVANAPRASHALSTFAPPSGSPTSPIMPKPYTRSVAL